MINIFFSTNLDDCRGSLFEVWKNILSLVYDSSSIDKSQRNLQHL